MRSRETSAATNGFTLIEVLLVLAISVILVASAVPIYTNLSSSAQINERTSQLTQSIRLAQVAAYGRINDTGHGVFLDPTAKSYTLFEGTSYAARNQSRDQTIVLDTSISLASTFPANQIYFAPGTGLPAATGTITLNHAVHGSHTISVNELGIVEEY